MTPTLSPIDLDQFSQDYHTYCFEMSIPEKLHLLGCLAIQMEWDQESPCDGYTLQKADQDHPFAEVSAALVTAVQFLEGKQPKELATWMLELAAAIEDELPV
jgi:hypothetical protein